MSDIVTKKLEKQYRLIQKHGVMTMSYCTETCTEFYNMYRNICDPETRKKMKYYMQIILKRNEHGVFCIPILIEKKYF